MKPFILLAGLSLISGSALAADPVLTPWRIVPAESKLGFTAHDVQGGTIAGSFAKFSGDIRFDPDHLAQSKVAIDVDIASATAEAPEAAEDLPKPEWLSVKAFPVAHYESRAITKRSDGAYEAQGTLALKGITLPVTLVFTTPVYGPKNGAGGAMRALAKGSAKLSRSAFKIGHNDAVADPVEVTFTLAAERP